MNRNYTQTQSVFLIGGIWLGMVPVQTGLISVAGEIQMRIVLFLSYLLLSWSIACLIFLLESTRQQLFQRSTPVRCGLLLGLLALLANFLAYLFSPLSFSETGYLLLIFPGGFIYGVMAGLLFCYLRNNERRV